MSKDVEVIKAIPIRHINVQVYQAEKVLTLQMTDEEAVWQGTISGKTLKKLGESIIDLLKHHPEVVGWEMPDTMLLPQSKGTH